MTWFFLSPLLSFFLPLTTPYLSLEAINIGSIKVSLTPSGVRAFDLQTLFTVPDIRSQDLRKLKEYFKGANKEQS